MNILAINFNHDGAAVLLKNGAIAGYVNTERFSRIKKHPGVREQELGNLLQQAQLSAAEVDLVQLVNLNNMDSPDVRKLYGGYLKETWPEFWINGPQTQIELLGETLPCQVLHHHHAYHAALVCLFSPFESGVVFACDPIGAAAYFFSEGRPLLIDQSSVDIRMVSAGVYAEVAKRIFGTGLVGAGKLMGLAPYGADSPPFDYSRLPQLGVKQACAALVAASSKDPVIVRENGAELNATLAHHAQTFLECELTEVLCRLHKMCLDLRIEPNLCLSGGTALNSSANQRCFAASPFRNVYLHPACGDDGMPIGTALLHWHFNLKQPRRPRSNREAMYSCKTYDRAEIDAAIARFQGKIAVKETCGEVAETADLLLAKKVVGWFQGASEIGPRALGNRSILANPTDPGVKDYLNATIKQREGFRPFAPSVLAEHAEACFGIADSPFMLRIAPVRRRDVPAVTHVDGTARFQTVAANDNPRFHQLITRFHERTGVPMVLNTSFNGKAEPIVETPEDAIRCMLKTNLDAVVFPGMIVSRL
jgi:carbamoyltransferase